MSGANQQPPPAYAPQAANAPPPPDVKDQKSGGVASAGVVELNIGGRYFTTTVDTLMKAKDSVLASWFKNRDSLPKDSAGRCFIDRDGSVFGHILNFLRAGYLPPSLTVNQKSLLLHDIKFYGLEGMKMSVNAIPANGGVVRAIKKLDYQYVRAQNAHTIKDDEWSDGWQPFGGIGVLAGNQPTQCFVKYG